MLSFDTACPDDPPLPFEDEPMPQAANQVAQVQEQPAGAIVQADATSLMAVISRAASDPNTDVDKLERLLGMYERITAKQAEAAYIAALRELQPKLPQITERGAIKNREGKVQSRYAKWEDINEAIRPLLQEHGFALSFRTGRDEQNRIAVTGVLAHDGGHSTETTITLPADDSGSKNSVQAVGSSISYGKRYTTLLLLNITARGEDDDGQKAGEPGVITDDQRDELQALIDDVKADKARFLRHYRIDKLADLPAAKLKEAIQFLEAKRVRA